MFSFAKNTEFDKEVLEYIENECRQIVLQLNPNTTERQYEKILENIGNSSLEEFKKLPKETMEGLIKRLMDFIPNNEKLFHQLLGKTMILTMLIISLLVSRDEEIFNNVEEPLASVFEEIIDEMIEKF